MAQITNINASPLVSYDEVLFITLKNGKVSRCDMKAVINELKGVINQLSIRIDEKDAKIEELTKKVEELTKNIKEA